MLVVFSGHKSPTSYVSNLLVWGLLRLTLINQIGRQFSKNIVEYSDPVDNLATLKSRSIPVN